MSLSSEVNQTWHEVTKKYQEEILDLRFQIINQNISLVKDKEYFYHIHNLLGTFLEKTLSVILSLDGKIDHDIECIIYDPSLTTRSKQLPICNCGRMELINQIKPLIEDVKSIQDSLNENESNFKDSI